MNHETITECLPIYALGALDGEELRELEAHLAQGCARCEQQLRDFDRVSDELALTIEPVAAPSRVRAAVLDRIGSLRADVTPPRTQGGIGAGAAGTTGFPGLRSAFAWAAGIAILVLSWNTYRLEQKITDQQSAISAMRGDLAQQTELVNFLQKPDVRIAGLQGLPKAPDALGRMIWDSRSQTGYFFASRLPAAPGDKTYQLWVIAGRKPLSAGTFKVDSKGQGVLKVDPVPDAVDVAAFAVTLEPAGGRSVPTLDQMVLQGTL